jgi:glycosyltransferase involved in cell wall biosynthesis
VSPEFSVVVPTHNRLDVLPEVLRAAEDQEGAPPYELLVVDDGSTDGTAEFLARRPWRIAAQVLRQPSRGPAAARNLGVRAARGRWVAFLGDDTVPAADWLARHREAHRRRGDAANLAVLGYTRWHPRIRPNPFLDYINEYGLQFGYSILPDPENVPFNFLYTSNLSLVRARLLEEPFDEAFPYPAWEDIETSYRLFRRGLRLVFARAAVALHDHPTGLRRFYERQEKAGYSAVVFFERHPELGDFLGLGPLGPPALPRRWRQSLRERLAEALQWTPVRTPRLWEDTLRFHYIRGLRRGWIDRAARIGRPAQEDGHENDTELAGIGLRGPGDSRRGAGLG